MPPHSSAGSDLDELVRQACAELQRRLRAGQPCQAETFLEALPTLASDPERALDLVVAEFLVRRELGQQPAPADWLRRFRQWRDRLRRRFEVLGVWTERVSEGETPAVDTEVQDTPAPTGERPAPALTHHELLEEIGQGGMGVVYRARDLVLGREVALKMLAPGLLAGPREVERFYREARAAAGLRHPNIVPIHGMGLHEGRHCFTMPLIPGGSLADHLADYRDVRSAVILVEKVARAVQVAHEAGIIHRDVKPGNILLDERGEPLVADFGLAKCADGGADLTCPGTPVGTPAYMSPEQAGGQGDHITARSDVWGLGAILYELLTGSRPFPGKDRDSVLNAVRTAEPQRPRKVRPELPRELETVVLKCLEKEPKCRYTSAAALADDLRNWLDNRAIRARRSGPLRQVARAIHRRPLVSLLLVLLAVALLFAGRRRPAPEGTIPPNVPAPREPLRFIGDSGLLHPHRWALGGGRWELAGDRVVRLNPLPKALCLFELLGRVPWDHYRFSVKVQHAGKRTGAVGAYITHLERAVGARPEHWFGSLTFGERPQFSPTAPGRPSRALAAFHLHRTGDRAKDNGFSMTSLVPRDRRFLPAPGQWRKLTLVVTPETVRAYWGDEGTPFSELIRATAMKEAVQMLAGLEPRSDHAPVLLPAQGALGLLCNEGEALFRDIVVEPFREPE